MLMSSGQRKLVVSCARCVHQALSRRTCVEMFLTVNVRQVIVAIDPILLLLNEIQKRLGMRGCSKSETVVDTAQTVSGDPTSSDDGCSQSRKSVFGGTGQ